MAENQVQVIIKSILTEGQDSALLTKLAPEDQVAVCAILLQVAEVDGEFVQEELEEIILQLRAYFGLSKLQAQELIGIAELRRAKSRDLLPFAQVIARSYSTQKKQEVLVMVWEVMYADNRLESYEEQLAQRLQSILAVDHSALMAAKAQAQTIMKARTDTPE